MAGTIPQHFIDEVVSRGDIVEIIGSRIQLKKAGREFKACCPFHDEKTPSFTVSPQKQFYHCFGCGAHGTAIGFLMEYDHMGFVEAVEELAGELGLEVPRERTGAPPPPSLDLFPVLEAAARFFKESLKRNAEAIEYVKGRGLTGEIALSFGVGYAPEGWDGLLREFGTDEHQLALLMQAGLIGKSDAGKYYDRFRHRIMFPIRDLKGRTIAFGGRILGDGEPKYLNSPETVLFHKGSELYGLYEARKASREISSMLVVEGYMDVVSLAQHGIHNSVATLGTATTGEQLRRLFRITDELVFCFDGDRAGRQAAWRALENALPYVREGRQMRFLFLPESEDPDSLVRREGGETFLARLSGAMPLSGFLIEHLSAEVDLESLDGRAKLAELARPLVKRIPRGIYRQLLVDELSGLVGLAAPKLAPLMTDEQPRSGDSPAKARRRLRRGVSAGRGNLVRQAISLLLNYPEIAGEIEDIERLRAVGRPGVDVLIELLEELRQAPNINTAGILERWRDREEAPHLMKLAMAEILVSRDMAASELHDALHRLMFEEGREIRARALLEKARNEPLSEAEKAELRTLLSANAGQRTETDDG